MAISLNNKCRLYIAAFAVALCVTGCVHEIPTSLTTRKAEVHEGTFSDHMPTKDFMNGGVQAVAAEYTRYGDNGIEILVTYDPQAQNYTARKATEDAAAIAEMLRHEYVSNVKTGILPLQGSGDNSQTFVSYNTYTAHPPAGCQQLVDSIYEKQDIAEDYEFGCSTETYFAQQIDKPKDLLGENSEMEPGDGRRLVTMVNSYKVGPMPDFENAEQASDE